MLEIIKNYLHWLFRVCINCSSFSCHDSLFCSDCEKNLWSKHRELKNYKLEAIDLYYLFDWYPDVDPLLNMLLPELKGCAPKSIYRFYAKRIADRLPIFQFPEGTVLVPCPGKPERMHALYLAQALSDELKLPILDILQLGDDQVEQKERDRFERSKIEMVLKSKELPRHVIFVDDIVTTGSTMKAAKQALKSVKSFKVFCLAYRRHLATKLTI